eukprot:CAMPEP_0116916550 /NCGR_PEP_ID=MMETSP0467-20121206/18603_1 /TAXON_ID=283647 /ORGANISM="Mesodinium pulex, Strain SPMC105" /LENGTH=118 /DNA_ID=CAMNT_0004593451 /DNA_START=507 /DNA_END=863 /DNA_ORIENTATION=-
MERLQAIKTGDKEKLSQLNNMRTYTNSRLAQSEGPRNKSELRHTKEKEDSINFSKLKNQNISGFEDDHDKEPESGSVKQNENFMSKVYTDLKKKNLNAPNNPMKILESIREKHNVGKK